MRGSAKIESTEDYVPKKKQRTRRGGPAKKPPSVVEALYPTVGKWVRYGGWIEIGERDGEGFLVRALDEGGLAFEDTKAKSLDEALAALEKGIASWIEELGIDLG